MIERPILFSGAMARAIREGRKTQTRRIVKPTMTTPKVAPLRMEPWLINGEQETDDDGAPLWAGFHPDYPGEAKWFSCPYGAPGDRLKVREAWYGFGHFEPTGELTESGKPKMRFVWSEDFQSFGYALNGKPTHTPPTNDPRDRWYRRPSIFMPRWASRITLEVVSVRVERVQDITPEDARAEGIEHLYAPRNAFASLWDSINAKRGAGWTVNPWVWVVEFKVVQP